jgi:hypothetical protein
LALDFWKSILFVNIMYDSMYLADDFNKFLKANCKSLIPRAQISCLIRENVLDAIPSTYEYNHSFSFSGKKHDFSFKGARGSLQALNLNKFDAQRKAWAKVVYFPGVTVSLNGVVVYTPPPITIYVYTKLT